MKASHIYIIGIVIFLGVMFAIERTLPKKFVWKATFGHNDYQPFGCAIFDDVMSASIPRANTSDTLPPYSVSDKTIYEMSLDSTVNRSLLLITDYLALSRTDKEGLLQMLDRGSKVMLVASGFDGQLMDTLCFDYEYNYFNINHLRHYTTTVGVRDSIRWARGGAFDDERIFRFFPHLSTTFFDDTDSLYTTLSVKAGHPLAVTRPYGRGQLTLVSTPLIFTNYGMLDGDNGDYIFRLLNQLDGLPVVRTEAYGNFGDEYEQTPLRYFLSQTPLRWGLYTTVVVILLFMAFTARREQRPIPVVRRPANKTMEFVQLIGTLYFRKKDHTGLVRKKFLYFAETLRRTIQIDIEDGEDDAELADRIAQKTGVDRHEVWRLLINIRPVARGEVKIDEQEMARYIEKINHIINHI